MPLPACAPTTQVQYYFVTAGPYNPEISIEDCRLQLDDVVHKVYKKFVSKCASSFEVGREDPDDPYFHIHIAIALNKPCRWARCNSQLRTLLQNWPRREAERRSVSTRFFYTGRAENPWKVMTDYLCQPTKEKQVGDYLEHSKVDYRNKKVIGLKCDHELTYEFFADVCSIPERERNEFCRTLHAKHVNIELHDQKKKSCDKRKHEDVCQQISKSW